MDEKSRGIDCWLVVGAALYWASVAVRHIGQAGDRLAPLDVAGTVGRYALLAVLLVLSYLAMRRLRPATTRLVLAGSVLCSGTFLLALSGIGEDVPPAVEVLSALCDIVTIAAFMMPWGASFASMDKFGAGRNVIATVLLAVGLILIGVLVTRLASTSAVLFAHVYVVASALVLLSGRVTITNTERTFVSGLHREKTFALLQRFAFGTFLGFAFCIAGTLETREVSYPLLLCGFAVVAAALGAYLHAPEGLYAGLPALLLAAIAAVYLPFSEPGVSSVNAMAPVLAWVAWSALSAFQLSDLKSRFGMDEFFLCFADKLAFSFALMLGSALFVALDAANVHATWGTGAGYALFAALGALILGSAYTMARLVSVHRNDEMRSEIDKTRRDRELALYDQLMREYGLSAREREVIELLAEGHSSVYIKDVMGISDGTVKAHVAHIYQKLGVHKKDELLSFIDARMGEV